MTQAERITDLEARVTELENLIVTRMLELHDLMQEVVAASRRQRKPLHVVPEPD